MAAHYDDPRYSYTDYWLGRDYEHSSEVMALNRLLSGLKFQSTLDLGGGFGRLTPTLAQYSKKVILMEPSAKHRLQARKMLAGYKNLSILHGTAQRTRLPSASQDLVIIIRVLHHLPDPLPALKEISRVLKPGGLLVLEFANSHHFKARVLSWISGQPILPIPIEKRSPVNIRRRTIPFVNHSPQTITRLIAKAGFQIQGQLSVSNLRHPHLKRLFPTSCLLTLERLLQPLLAPIYFGPSIIILAKLATP